MHAGVGQAVLQWAVLDHPEHSEEMLIAHVGVRFDADSFAENDEAPADEPP
jgi:hypothetical protein